MSNLNGRRVALLEGRLSDDAAALVRKLGGSPYSVPAVRELVHREEVQRLLDALAANELAVVVFLTGVGVSALLSEAGRLGCLTETLDALRRTTVACRGPKPARVLTQHGVTVHIAAGEPYTTKELIAALEGTDLRGKVVGIVHYGKPNRLLTSALSTRGARLSDIHLYEWTMPEERKPLQTLITELIDGRVDAIAFTNEVQCRHLFRLAAELGSSDELSNALGTNTVVAAVGPVCAEALQAFGVTPDVIPARPNMDSMMTALADYFELTDGLSEDIG